MEKEVKRVRKNFRFRPDILAELEGLVVILNRDRSEDANVITETFIIESAIVAYVKTIKRSIEMLKNTKSAIGESKNLSNEQLRDLPN